MSAATTHESDMPEGFSPRALRRRALAVVAALTVLVLVALLTPGLGEVRDRLASASPAWLTLAVALELGSCASYVLMVRPIFCSTLPWRTTIELGLSEQAAISLVPATGASGLALGAWVLRREGLPAERIAHRSVAFFLIKSSVNFAAVVISGVAMAAGLGRAEVSPWLTAGAAGIAATVIAAVLLVPRLGPGPEPGAKAGRVRRGVHSVREALISGTGEAVTVVRSGNVAVIGGAVGYWAFDNAMLWATFHALGEAPPLLVILMGYLIGQLGGLLPLPGGVGGVDGGLIGALVVYGAPATATIAAVLAFRLILFWVPLLIGTPAFLALYRRELQPAESHAASDSSGA